MAIDPLYVPKTPEEFDRCMMNAMWRLHNLYYITIKDPDEEEEDLDQYKEIEEDDDSFVAKFVPNDAQLSLFKNLWYRNVIPKARQRGITTGVCILALDFCIFRKNFPASIIAHKMPDAQKILRNKIVFAYERLIPAVQNKAPIVKKNSEEMVFGNGSHITVSTSARSMTPQLLHVSEYGKICAKFPDRAFEIQTGSFPAVPKKGIIILESTGEGIDGDFHKKSMRAKANKDKGKKLTMREYRLHFFSWWDADEYQIDPEGVIITPEDHEYFDKLEKIIGRKVNIERRAWYCATRDEEFNGDRSKMMQEYPSTVEEAFQSSIEGAYFSEELARANRERRIIELPVLDQPVDTVWDLGKNDTNVIWFRQTVGPWHHYIDYYENNGYGPKHYADILREKHRERGFSYGDHIMPHDVKVRDFSLESNKDRQDIFEENGVKPIIKVDRTNDLQQSIDVTRTYLSKCLIDPVHCAKGLKWLSLYKKEWDDKRACYRDHPAKGPANHAADAIRQAAQNDEVEIDTSAIRRRRKRRSVRTA